MVFVKDLQLEMIDEFYFEKTTFRCFYVLNTQFLR